MKKIIIALTVLVLTSQATYSKEAEGKHSHEKIRYRDSYFEIGCITKQEMMNYIAQNKSLIRFKTLTDKNSLYSKNKKNRWKDNNIFFITYLRPYRALPALKINVTEMPDNLKICTYRKKSSRGTPYHRDVNILDTSIRAGSDESKKAHLKYLVDYYSFKAPKGKNKRIEFLRSRHVRKADWLGFMSLEEYAELKKMN